jgi:CheY-like chemotaxis protein
MGFINILKDKEVEKEKLKFLNIIENSSKSLINIISDILDYSKIESGKFDISKIQFESIEPFEESVDLFYEKAHEKNIKINKIFSDDLPLSMLGDKLRIKQIVNNLLSNAIKFSPEDSMIDVVVEFDRLKDILICHVKDNGIGMSKDDANKLFNAFTQVGKAKTGVSGGTGLGLSISKNLIKLMGGEINVVSEPNKGSDFNFYLPLYSSEVIQKEACNEEENILDKDVCFKGTHVLVVEDNKTNQMLIEIMLDELEITCDMADDGIIGLQKYKNDTKYDLILMDENMPNMNGTEATIEIRKYEKENTLEPIVIIAVTANAIVGDKDKFLSIGMNDYISKPINNDELVSTLSKYV